VTSLAADAPDSSLRALGLEPRSPRVYRPFSVPYNELAAKESAPALYRNAEDVFGAGVALPAPPVDSRVSLKTGKEVKVGNVPNGVLLS